MPAFERYRICRGGITGSGILFGEASRTAFLLPDDKRELPAYIHREQGLDHDCINTGFPDIIREIVPVVAGEEDYYRLAIIQLADLLRQLQAIHSRHPHISKYHLIGGAFIDLLLYALIRVF